MRAFTSPAASTKVQDYSHFLALTGFKHETRNGEEEAQEDDGGDDGKEGDGDDVDGDDDADVEVGASPDTYLRDSLCFLLRLTPTQT